MSKCIICGTRPRQVPDRNSGSLRPTKKICRECHADRLRGDMRHILNVEAQREHERSGGRADDE